MLEELKHCPFCGGPAHEEGGNLVANIGPFVKPKERFTAKWSVGCGACGIWITRETAYDFNSKTESLEITGKDGHADAVSTWNRRAHEA